ncbi:unnamed protein product [Fraxinus pennsylvanica]|uniref:Protein kinase domain-containing protein n=1 Tax=Fraxinus pennsylvanica TaxID=56036 RepID=A0AAD1ZLX2_9LAMI|nr:unnamed protein product [Fraxinus pennsylvanica]
MKLLGSIKHDNVVIPRGYHFSKDYKFILYDHYEQGNVSAMLHASNVFLNSHRYGCISDLGFANLISPAMPPFMWIGGYAAPEVVDAGIVSQASDVYSFGVLLHELLTGKSPINYRVNDKAEDFVKWVHSILREEWNVTFNFICTNIGELVEILKIGMSCVARVPEHRPKMSDVVKMMENVGKLNADLDYSPLLVSETPSTNFEHSGLRFPANLSLTAVFAAFVVCFSGLYADVIHPALVDRIKEGLKRWEEVSVNFCLLEDK